jgi:hypothetical protein
MFGIAALMGLMQQSKVLDNTRRVKEDTNGRSDTVQVAPSWSDMEWEEAW